MKSNFILRTAAGMLAMALAAGALPALPPASDLQLFPAITASAETAAPSVDFDESTGTLTISGNFSDNEGILRTAPLNKAKHFIAKPGTVFPANIGGLFAGSGMLETADLSGADLSGVTSLGGMFTSNLKLISVDFTDTDLSSAESLSSMFSSCTSLKTVKGLKVSSSALTSVLNMFYGCRNLEQLDLSGLNTSHITDFRCMFQNCSALYTLDLSAFDTSSAELMDNMFCGCSSLTTLDLSSFETANVTSMSNMFSSCISLRDLNIQSFDTSAVTSMRCMFFGCKALTALDLSGFKTESCTSMREMFSDCGQLSALNLSSFTIADGTDVLWMLEDTVHLEKLTLGEGITDITDKMELRQPFFGWENTNDPDISVSGTERYAVFENQGLNTYRSADACELEDVSMQVTLDGSIGLKFTARLSERAQTLNVENNPFIFHFHNRDSYFAEYPSGFAVVEATCEADGIYTAVCKLPAKHMTDEILVETWLLSDPDDEDGISGDRVSISVRQYANVILSDPDKYAAEQDLIKAMLKYGGMAQRHFDYLSDPETYFYADAGISDSESAMPEANSFVKPAPLAGLSYYGTSILLKSRTVQRHYFKLTAGDISDYSFTVNEKAAEPVQYKDTNWYYIDTEGLVAQKLDQPVSIAVISQNDPSKKMSYRYSVMDYVTKGLKSDESDTAAAVLAALNQFAKEAVKYFA